MRYAIVAMLLGACASHLPPRRSAAYKEIEAIEAEAIYQRFYKEFTLGHYDEAKAIVDRMKVDQKRVVPIVLAGMWEEMLGWADIEAIKNNADKFGLDYKTQMSFAKNAFNFSIKQHNCEAAAKLAFIFHLGQIDADAAIICAQARYDPESFYTLVFIAQLTCQYPGTRSLQEKVMAEWIEIFERTKADDRSYMSMAEIADLCPFTADQYEGLFNFGLFYQQLDFSLAVIQTSNYKAFGFDLQPKYRRLYDAAFASPPGVGIFSLLPYWSHIDLGFKNFSVTKKEKLMFVEALLDNSDFQKTPADYEKFVVAATNQLECGKAASTAIAQGLSDDLVKSIFLNPKCFGGTLAQMDLWVVPPQKARWLFDLSLQAHEFLLARNLVNKFGLGEASFNLIVDQAVAARDFEQIIEFSPPANLTNQAYKDEILGKAISLNEEWFVARYAAARLVTSNIRYMNSGGVVISSENITWDRWIELAYTHALRRKSFSLAADIANQREFPEARSLGIAQAFAVACKANIEEAKVIAIRWPNTERAAWLDEQKQKAEKAARNRARNRAWKKRACQDDWCVTPVK